MTRIETPVVTIDFNVDLKVRELIAYAKAFKTSILVDAFKVIMDYIGSVSAEDYWEQTSASAGEHITQSVSDKITQRSGRLIGSVVGAFRFSKVDLPGSVDRFSKEQFTSSKEDFAGGKSEAIREAKMTSTGVLALIGSEVEYAAIHEFGGVTGINQSATIPKRPYLLPAIKDSKVTARKIINEAVHATFEEANV